MVTTTYQMSPEEFLTYAEQHPDTRFDFMDGEVVEVSPKPWHAWLQAYIARLLGNYLVDHPIGHVHTEALHVLNDEKFLPDVSVNSAILRDEPYFTEPPLLTVEIRSDSQSRESQRRKARAYVAAGVHKVWLVMPGEQIEVYTPGQDDPTIYTSEDTLTGGDVLLGFEMSVAEILK